MLDQTSLPQRAGVKPKYDARRARGSEPGIIRLAGAGRTRQGRTVLRTERRLIPLDRGTVPQAVSEVEPEPGLPAAASSSTIRRAGT